MNPNRTPYGKQHLEKLAQDLDDLADYLDDDGKPSKARQLEIARRIILEMRAEN